MTQQLPPKNSRWKHVATKELHIVIMAENDEIVTIAVSGSWLGEPDQFYAEFSKVQ